MTAVTEVGGTVNLLLSGTLRPCALIKFRRYNKVNLAVRVARG